MDRNTFLDAFTEIDDRYLIEAKPIRKEKKMSKVFAAFLAAAALLCGAVITLTNVSMSKGQKEGNMIALSDASYGVTAEVVENPEQPMMPMLKLLELSEPELFSHWPTVIVRGRVTNIRNIRLTAADDISVTRAVVTVKPSKVLRGSAASDVTILVSCPIDGRFLMEDTETVSAIRVGMEGIFMVLPYGDDECWELENASLRWKDLADYSFPDGRRYAFLDTGSGLLYADWAYPGLAGAATLDDVEAYVERMIH